MLDSEIGEGIISSTGLTLQKFKRKYYFIADYTFTASYFQESFLFLPAWQCNIQDSLCKHLYKFKLL